MTHSIIYPQGLLTSLVETNFEVWIPQNGTQVREDMEVQIVELSDR